jgi:hypothetical protein
MRPANYVLLRWYPEENSNGQGIDLRERAKDFVRVVAEPRRNAIWERWP